MGIAKFEEIEAWQVARELSQAIYHATTGPRFSRDYGLPRRNIIPRGGRDQVQRAAVSIMANIARPVK